MTPAGGAGDSAAPPLAFGAKRKAEISDDRNRTPNP